MSARVHRGDWVGIGWGYMMLLKSLSHSVLFSTLRKVLEKIAIVNVL